MEKFTIKEVFESVDALVAQCNIQARNANTLRLLAEEMYGMMEGLLNVTDLNFDCSVSSGGVFELRLSANAIVTLSAKEHILKTATDRKNSAQKGIWGKIRGIFEDALCNPEMVLVSGPGHTMQGDFTPLWTMSEYMMTDETKKADSWDGLERSILMNAADDVAVGVRYNKVEMIVKKRFNA